MVSDLCPALVLLDTNLPGEDVVRVLQRIKADGCSPRCLVLVDTRQQQRDAIATGADVALLKGYPTTKLFEVIQTLTAQRETHGELASRTIGT
jgi:DNA-binding NarL/FixJ family response regulator